MDLERRKGTFNQIPELYDQVRPGYPQQILEAVEARAQLSSTAHIVEIGAGTGKATEYFVKRDYKITAVELGGDLCAYLKRKFSDVPDLYVEHTSFEEWKGASAAYDLFLSAQAFHFINPDFGLAKAASLLKPGGLIALLWNVEGSGGSEFYERFSHIHKRYLPGSGGISETERFVALYEAALHGSGCFTDFEKLQHIWDQTYSADEFLRLRSTFSPDLLLEERLRADFYRETRDLIESMGGFVTRRYVTTVLTGLRLP